MRDMLRLGLILMVIAGVAGGSLALVNSFTQPRIEAATAKALQDSLRQVMPGADEFVLQDELKDKAPEAARKILADGSVYLAKAGGKVAGIVVTDKPYGYSSTPLTIMVGVSSSGAVTGVRVISQSETVGLGTRVTEPEFLTQKAFAEARASDTLKVKKDGGRVDAIAGATYSSRAVVNGVNAATELFRAVAADLGLTF